MTVQLIMAFLGTAGFALFCGERKKFVPVAALGGVICWGTYLLFDYIGAGLFFSSLFSAVFAAIYGEVCARILKAPAVIFFTPAVIALIPGRTLYYCAAAMVDNNFALAGDFAWQTAQCALAIAAGIGVVLSVFDGVEKFRKKI